jgi:hypothetical protein
MKLALLTLAAALPLAAQIPFSCTLEAPDAPQVRSEGRTELVADIVLTCTGGAPTGGEQNIPARNITLTFNANVTSRILGAGNASEALLLLDDPFPGEPGQFPCAQPTCTSVGGFPYGAPPQGNANVFQGAVGTGTAANSITWSNVPVDPPGAEGTRTFRFTNVRLDASKGTPLQLIGISALTTLDGPVTVATPAFSMTAAVRDAASATAAPQGVSVTLAAAGAPATRVATLRFNPVVGATRPRTEAFSQSIDVSPPPAPQNFPGFFFNSESGFYNPDFPTATANGSNLATAGLADWGTRLMATFTNVPPNVTIYVSLRNDGATTFNGVAARLVNTDANGAGPFAAVAGDGTIARLVPVNGTAIAVWEVVSTGFSPGFASGAFLRQGFQQRPRAVPFALALNQYDFGVYFSYGQGIFAAPTPVQVNMRFGPLTGIPAFTGVTAGTQPLATFTATAPPPLPVLSVSPGSLTFLGTAGGQNPAAQTLTIGSSPASVGYSLSGTGALALRFQPTGGVTPDSSAVSINTQGMLAGTYRDVITVNGPGVSVPLAVTLILAPGPSISSINPSSKLAGSPAFTLTVNGANFTSSTTVAWNGSPLATTFGSSGVLTAAVPAALVTTAGQASITAVTSDKATSNAVTFTILPFVLSSIDPGAVAAGGPSFTLTATGAGFQTGATLNVGGSSLQPGSATATSLTVTVPAATIAQTGELSISVSNPGGLTSNALTLKVTAPITLTSINPNTVTATAAAFTLNLSGSGFLSGAAVLVGSSSLTPSSLSATAAAAPVPAALIAQPGSLAVRVANPGNVASNSLTLTVNPPPRITALAPSSITAGAPQFTMSVTGTNLFNGTTVQWNGQGLATTFVSTTQLTAVVPASAVAAPGAASVSAITQDGVASNSLPFTINAGFTITALSPATANVGSAAFPLTVTGTNLPAGVAVSFGGQTLATTVVSATQLTAQVPANLLTAASTVNVTATSPDGATSNALPFRIVLPPLPTVSFTVPSTAPSGQDQTVTLTLGGTYPVDLRGTVTLTFVPDGTLPDDPAIQFKNGARTFTFTIPAGTPPTIPQLLVKTGTVAGVITMTVTFTATGGADVTPGTVTPQRIQIGRAAPIISSLTCTRNATGFTVVVDGYTNTREATQATFDFTAASGASLGTAQVVVTTGSLFGGWFGSTGAATSGGLFRYTQPFTVQGSATTVASLTVKLGNSAGTSASASCQLQ